MLLRVFRLLWRGVLTVVRALFIVVLLILPLPVGELMVRLVDKYRRNQVTQLQKKENKS